MSIYKKIARNRLSSNFIKITIFYMFEKNYSARIYQANYKRMEKALAFIEERKAEKPDLKEIASASGLSEFHFHKLFSDYVGVSPKKYMQYLTISEAKKVLDRSSGILEASLELGLSGPSRLYDLFITAEAVAPGQYKSRGEGLKINYAIFNSPFGECLIAATPKGLCYLKFGREKGRRELIGKLISFWKNAGITENPAVMTDYVEAVLEIFNNRKFGPLRIFLKGGNFQLKVWEALMRIPPGALATYGDIANYIGSPSSSRAVGSAVGKNPLPFLIPCHRVIRSSGIIGEYAEGPLRKKLFIARELAEFDKNRE